MFIYVKKPTEKERKTLDLSGSFCYNDNIQTTGKQA